MSIISLLRTTWRPNPLALAPNTSSVFAKYFACQATTKLPVPGLESSEEEAMLEKIRQGIAPATGESFTSIECQVFGVLPPPTTGDGRRYHGRTGRGILRAPLLGKKIASYYPPTPEMNMMTFDPDMNPLRIRRAEKLERLRISGSGPPKKGAGKRASKKK